MAAYKTCKSHRGIFWIRQRFEKAFRLQRLIHGFRVLGFRLQGLTRLSSTGIKTGTARVQMITDRIRNSKGVPPAEIGGFRVWTSKPGSSEQVVGATGIYTTPHENTD